jgi:hypothetical protein
MNKMMIQIAMKKIIAAKPIYKIKDNSKIKRIKQIKINYKLKKQKTAKRN